MAEDSPHLPGFPTGTSNRHSHERNAGINLDADMIQMMALMERQVKESASSSVETAMIKDAALTASEATDLDDSSSGKNDYSHSQKDAAHPVMSSEDYMELLRLHMMSQAVKQQNPTGPEDFMRLPHTMEANKDHYQRPSKEVVQSSDDVLQMIRMMEEVVKDPSPRGVKEASPVTMATTNLMAPPQTSHLTYLPHNTPMMQVAGPVLDNSQPIEKAYTPASTTFSLPPMRHMISPLSKSASTLGHLPPVSSSLGHLPPVSSSLGHHPSASGGLGHLPPTVSASGLGHLTSVSVNSLGHLPPVSTLTESKQSEDQERSIASSASQSMLSTSHASVYGLHLEETLAMKDYSIGQHLVKDYSAGSLPMVKDYPAPKDYSVSTVKDYSHASIIGIRDYAQPHVGNKEPTHLPHTISKSYSQGSHDTTKDYPHSVLKDYGKDYTSALIMSHVEAQLAREATAPPKELTDTERYMLQAGLLTHTGILPSMHLPASTTTTEQVTQPPLNIVREIAEESLQFRSPQLSHTECTSQSASPVLQPSIGSAIPEYVKEEAQSSSSSTPKSRDHFEHNYERQHYEQHLGHVLADVQSASQGQSSEVTRGYEHTKVATPLMETSSSVTNTQSHQNQVPLLPMQAESSDNALLSAVSRSSTDLIHHDTLGLPSFISNNQSYNRTASATPAVTEPFTVPKLSGHHRGMPHIAELLATPATPRQKSTSAITYKHIMPVERTTQQTSHSMRLEAITSQPHEPIRLETTPRQLEPAMRLERSVLPPEKTPETTSMRPDRAVPQARTAARTERMDPQPVPGMRLEQAVQVAHLLNQQIQRTLQDQDATETQPEPEKVGTMTNVEEAIESLPELHADAPATSGETGMECPAELRESLPPPEPTAQTPIASSGTGSPNKKDQDGIPELIDSSNCGRLRFMQLQRRGIDNRSIHEHWFVTFPWLQLDTTKILFTCKTCQQAEVKESPLFDGISALTPKKSNFASHEASIPHKEAWMILEMAATEAVKKSRKGPIDEVPKEKENSEPPNEKEGEEDLVDTQNAPRRNIRKDWFKKFPWLDLDNTKGCFFCTLCIRHNQTSIFTSGKPVGNPKKDNFSKHEDTEGHKVSLLMETGMSADEAKEALVANPNIISTLPKSTEQTGREQEDGNQQQSDTITSQLSESEKQKREVLKLSAKAFFDFCLQDRGSSKKYIELDWFALLPWLEVDPSRDVFLCKYCRCYNAETAYGKGQPIGEPNLASLKRHEASSTHSKALKVAILDSDEQALFEPLHEGVVDAAVVIQYSNISREDTEKLVMPVFLRYPWLQYDDASCIFYCALCHFETLIQESVISEGVVTPEQLKQHEQVDAHKTLVDKKENSTKDSLDNKYRSAVKSAEVDVAELPWSEAFWSYADQLRKLGLLCDITLIIHDLESKQQTSLPTHKLILVCASEYFKMRLRDGTLSAQCVLDHVTAKGMEGVLNFLYGQPVTIPPCFYQEALQAATSLLIPKAQEFFEYLLAAYNFQLEPSFLKHGLGRQRAAPRPAVSQEDVENVSPEEMLEEPVGEGAEEGAEEPGAETDYEYTIITTAVSNNSPRVRRGVKRSSNSRPRGRPPKKKPFVAPQLVDPIRLKLRLTGRKGKLRRDNITSSTPPMPAQPTTPVVANTVAKHVAEKTSAETKEEEAVTTPPHREIRKYEYAADRKRKLAAFLPSCDICGKKFLRKGCIQRHKEKHHGSNQQKATFKCDECPKQCPSRHDLKLHKRLHSGERPFVCQECGKAFTRKETLTEHEYTHKPDGEKPHQCPECGKGFFKMHDLQRHYTGLHSGAKPFQCHLCGKAFPWARSLQDHLSAHQGPDRRRPYKCPECYMTFVRKYDLNRHSITHTKQKPFMCEWCNHAFTQKGSMDKHKREFCRSRPGAQISDKPPEEGENNTSQQELEEHVTSIICYI